MYSSILTRLPTAIPVAAPARILVIFPKEEKKKKRRKTSLHAPLALLRYSKHIRQLQVNSEKKGKQISCPQVLVFFFSPGINDRSDSRDSDWESAPSPSSPSSTSPRSHIHTCGNEYRIMDSMTGEKKMFASLVLFCLIYSLTVCPSSVNLSSCKTSLDF